MRYDFIQAYFETNECAQWFLRPPDFRVDFVCACRQLNLKEVHVQVALGDLVLRLWNQAPQGTRHILPRGYDNQRGTADHFGSVACFAGETSSYTNQNVFSFTRMTLDRSDSRAVHIFRVWDPYGFNGSIGTFPCPMRFIRLKDLGSGKAWHPCCRFFMMLECLFRLAYVFLSQQKLYKSTCFLKCHYCVV